MVLIKGEELFQELHPLEKACAQRIGIKEDTDIVVVPHHKRDDYTVVLDTTDMENAKCLQWLTKATKEALGRKYRNWQAEEEKKTRRKRRESDPDWTPKKSTQKKKPNKGKAYKAI